MVRPGDSLWSIAAALLGDGDDWPAIAALNLGRTMADGLRFVDPNTIHAGWTLEVPDQGAPLSDADVARRTGRPRPAPPAHSARDLARPWLPLGARTADGSRSDDAPALPFHGEALVLARTGSLEGAGSAHLDLPELAALGIGALACAALTRRARRTRLLRQVTHEEGDPGASPSPRLPSTPTSGWGAAPGLPALRAFEAANYGVAAGSGGSVGGRRADTGGLRWRGRGRLLAMPNRDDRHRTVSSSLPTVRSGMRGHGAFSSLRAGHPLLPIVLPVGEDETRDLAGPRRTGMHAPPLGRGCARLVASGSSGPRSVVVGRHGPGHRGGARRHRRTAACATRLRDPGADSVHVLYFGDPAELPDAVAQRVSIVTLAHGPASDVAVFVDQRAASIHPLGRTVRPHLMDGPTSRLIREIVEPPHPLAIVNHRAGALTGDRSPTGRALAPPHTTYGGPRYRRPTRRRHPVPDPVSIDVKLLTTTPRLDGLPRCIAGQPGPTGSRARRIPGPAPPRPGHQRSAAHPGAGLFGRRRRVQDPVQHRHRRPAGHGHQRDSDSRSFRPAAVPATTGSPRTSPSTSTGRPSGWIGRATEDPDRPSPSSARSAGLIEGEPLANALSGFTWWDAEGHGARSPPRWSTPPARWPHWPSAAGCFDLAMWGLEQARLVDPYSEALSRAAMQVAAAAGDADRLRREWRECQRRVDELDPGSTPSARTERLYGELAHCPGGRLPGRLWR